MDSCVKQMMPDAIKALFLVFIVSPKGNKISRIDAKAVSPRFIFKANITIKIMQRYPANPVSGFKELHYVKPPETAENLFYSFIFPLW